MIIVNTGQGKGKTTAACGQTLRALGQGMRAAFCQFMKRDGQAGEQHMLKKLLGDDFLAGGKGFFRNEQERSEHRQAALAVLAWAKERLESGVDLLVADEALYALGSDLLTEQEILSLCDLAGEPDATPHLVLTGRDCPPVLLERAHLVTEMTLLKHPFEQGVKAQAGIEY